MDDLAELKRRYDSRTVGEEVAANGDEENDDQGNAADLCGFAQYQDCCLSSCDGEVIPSRFSILGQYPGSVVASHENAACFLTVDGYQFDAATLPTAVELGPLLVQPHPDQADQGQDHLLQEHDDQGAGLDTLHGVITSTGFYLD